MFDILTKIFDILSICWEYVQGFFVSAGQFFRVLGTYISIAFSSIGMMFSTFPLISIVIISVLCISIIFLVLGR